MIVRLNKNTRETSQDNQMDKIIIFKNRVKFSLNFYSGRGMQTLASRPVQEGRRMRVLTRIRHVQNARVLLLLQIQ